MAKSTWYNITHGMQEALHKGYVSKSERQRRKREVVDIVSRGDEFCDEMQKILEEGTYVMGDYRHFILRDAKKMRNISVLPFRDRVVQNCIKNAIEKRLLLNMTDDMMGGLPKRGILVTDNCHGVVRRMVRIFNDNTITHYIQGDISKFYDNVDKVVVIRMVERVVSDKRTLEIIRQHLFKQKRLAIGDPFSHLIANLVMSYIVRRIKERYGRSIRLVNFADDIFIGGHSKEELEDVRRYMCSVAKEIRLHYKNIYIRPMDDTHGVVFCGFKYFRGRVLLTQRTKKRYIKARHKELSMSSYNGILMVADTKRLRYLVETNDNMHMSEKIRRAFAGKAVKIDNLVGVVHTVVRCEERKSRQMHSDTYMHVQALSDELGLIVYTTSSPKIVQYLKENAAPLRDVKIVHDWSGFYYEGTVYTDEEEEAMLREQFKVPKKQNQTTL